MPAAKKNLKAANRSGNSVQALTRRFQKCQVGPQVQHQQDSSAEEEDSGSADGSDRSEDGSDGSEEEMDWEKSYWNLKKENEELLEKNRILEKQNRRDSRRIKRLEQDQEDDRLLNERIRNLKLKIKLAEAREEISRLKDDLESANEERSRLEEQLESAADEDSLTWPKEIEKSVTNGWHTRHDFRYKKVKVLLVRWESDDLKVHRELDKLAGVFTKHYDYKVSRYSIPDDEPARALSGRVEKFIGRSSPTTLLIFYYSGHGTISKLRRDHKWAANADGGPSMSSLGIQTMFEQTASDALLFYDACNSAETAVTTQYQRQRGITELISACGFQTTTPGVCKDSFSYTLTNVLRSLSKTGEFSISELFSQVLAKLRTPSQEGRTNPVHTSLTFEPNRRHIMLQPLSHDSAARTLDSASSNSWSPPFPIYFNIAGDDPDPEAWREWILKAPSDASAIFFEHPSHDTGRYNIRDQRSLLERLLEPDEGYKSRTSSRRNISND